MRDIRSDLQERTSFIEEQITSVYAHFEKTIQQGDVVQSLAPGGTGWWPDMLCIVPGLEPCRRLRSRRSLTQWAFRDNQWAADASCTTVVIKPVEINVSLDHERRSTTSKRDRDVVLFRGRSTL